MYERMNIFHAIAHSKRQLQQRDQSRPRHQHTKTECLADGRAKLLEGHTSQAPSPVPQAQKASATSKSYSLNFVLLLLPEVFESSRSSFL
jgi:hypothetical protein